MKKTSKKTKKIIAVSAFAALYITGAVIGASQVAAARLNGRDLMRQQMMEEISSYSRMLETATPEYLATTVTLGPLTNVPDHEKFDCSPKVTTSKTEKPAETTVPAKTEKPVVTTTPARPSGTKPSVTTTVTTTEKVALTEEELREKQLEFANEVLRLCNIEREKAGVAPLTLSDDLNFIAQIRTDEQTEVGEISHTRPNGTRWSTVFQNVNVAKRTWGENLIQGYTTPEDVVEAWMNSPGHRGNIIRESFKQLGIGVSFVDDECEQSFIVTQIFIG
ncbi:MAG: CAP domain-containing protein [Oscillospiraceae bacterium]|nr:CAP domain-containing protein [Oscillospiraceae bacterium]